MGQGFCAISRQFSPGVQMGLCQAHPQSSPYCPHIPHGMGPHDPRTFTRDGSAVSWVSVGSGGRQFRLIGRRLGSVGGQNLTPLGDRIPSQVTTFLPRDGFQNI
uniref:Uncharacterized protein n=1 Tax=Eutreptiella gymnastica TaxID=73025 RepID=A0A7S1I7Q9_9EUGL